MATSAPTQSDRAESQATEFDQLLSRPVGTKANFVALLSRQKSAFEMALPKHISADKMYRVLLTAVNRVPKLLQCTGESLLAAAMAACETGLLPSGILGEAAIVPFTNRRRNVVEAVFVVGYKGLVKLIMQTGQYEEVRATIVFDCDEFEATEGTEPRLTHTPKMDHADWGNVNHVIGAYATTLRKGARFRQYTYVPLKRILAIKNQSPAARGGDSPWNHPDNYWWMYAKTAIKQHSKLIEVSSELQTAIFADDRGESGQSMADVLKELREESAERIQSVIEDRVESLKEKLAQRVSTSPEPPAASAAAESANVPETPETPPEPSVEAEEPAGLEQQNRFSPDESQSAEWRDYYLGELSGKTLDAAAVLRELESRTDCMTAADIAAVRAACGRKPRHAAAAPRG